VYCWYRKNKNCKLTQLDIRVPYESERELLKQVPLESEQPAIRNVGPTVQKQRAG
jgi:hypothetical protein